MTQGRRPARRLLRASTLALAFLGLGVVAPRGARSDDIPQRPGEPHIGYAYPGGGQIGRTVKVAVGGQYLRDVYAVHVSGQGVSARVRFWYPQAPNLDGDQSRELRRLLKEARDRIFASVTPGPERRGRGGQPTRPGRPEAKEDPPKDPVKLPDHPLLARLPELDLEELQDTARLFFTRRNQLQRKQSIEETVKLEVAIAADAEPGVREIRLLTRAGLSNPLRFRVGLVPEVREQEPNDTVGPEAAPIALPATVNGQILPQDVDRFRFRASAGQRLVCRAEARSLVPYQADSVPGWMQATLTLYDEDGKEVAYADEYRFDPDPVLFYEVPADGLYDLVVEDSIARGREDFVYRVTVGELPFVTRVFPLGGQVGTLTRAEVEGWNLGWTQVPLDTRPALQGVRETAWRTTEGPTNEVTYAVGTLPEIAEQGENDDPAHAPTLELPVVVNGRIETPGDVDVYAFEGRTGQDVVAQVVARELGSPLDSLLRIVDAKGTVLAWNDDFVHEGLGVRGLGLQTHHADSYVRATLPKSGTYYVRVADVRKHGSLDHAYRLRVSLPRPDVHLFVNPSAINVPVGRATVIAVRALRIDGFDGEVDIRLKDAPAGFELGGARIAPGRERVLMTLTAPRGQPIDPFRLHLVGEFTLDGETVEREVQPADNLMQAFLWRHIVPAQDLMVTTTGQGGGAPAVRVADEKPTRVPQGGKAKVRLEVDGRLPVPLKDLRFEVFDAPKGITVGEARPAGGGFTLEIQADKDVERTEAVDNLIVQVFLEPEADAAKRRARRAQRLLRYPIGYLPAIPFRVARR